MDPVYTPILENARLELQGAEQRLARAQLAFNTFVEEHGQLSDDSQLIYASTPTPAMRASLDDEFESLGVEVDEAHRRVQCATEIIEQMQLCISVENDTLSDLVLGLPEEDEAEGFR